MPHACPPLCTGASRGQRRARVRLGSSGENAAAPAPALNLSRRDGNAVSSRSPTGLFYAHQFCLRLLPGQPTAGSWRPARGGAAATPRGQRGEGQALPLRWEPALGCCHLPPNEFKLEEDFSAGSPVWQHPSGWDFPPTPTAHISLWGEALYGRFRGVGRQKTFSLMAPIAG